MFTVPVFVLLAVASHLPPVRNRDETSSSISQQVLVEAPKSPNRLSLYNENGELVARCEKAEQSFRDCKLEPGVTLDDLMNAWVHAYLEVQK